jgi:ribosome-dependent ATPase
VFAKALGVAALWPNAVAILAIGLVYLGLSLLLLRKQEA